jgi:hypothetical protein
VIINDFHNRFETEHKNGEAHPIGVMDDISKAPDNEESIA